MLKPDYNSAKHNMIVSKILKLADDIAMASKLGYGNYIIKKIKTLKVKIN